MIFLHYYKNIFLIEGNLKNAFQCCSFETSHPRLNSIKTCILSRVKQITSPGWMHETSARTWCTGKTWREWVEREVGGGIGMRNTCKPMAVSFQCMTKFTTNKKRKKEKKKRQSNQKAM